MPENSRILNHDGFCIMVLGGLSQLCSHDSTNSCSDCTTPYLRDLHDQASTCLWTETAWITVETPLVLPASASFCIVSARMLPEDAAAACRALSRTKFFDNDILRPPRLCSHKQQDVHGGRIRRMMFCARSDSNFA